MNVDYYSFLAIRGRQGETEYYLTQCPLRLVPRLFLFNEAEIPAHLRQVRSLNAHRIEGLTQYLIGRSSEYVLAPLIASVDSEMNFESLTSDLSEVGQLRIPLTARLVIHDGQHRRVAIDQALIKNPAIGDDTVPIMLFPDPQLARSSRLYADLNQPHKRRTQSQQVLHDQDSPLAILVRQLINDIPLFRGLTELEKTTISNRSTALFTLSTVYQATQALLGVGKRDPLEQEQATLARQFWQELGEIIPEWQEIIQEKVKAVELRQNYIHAHGVTLVAIGYAGHELVKTFPDDWPKRLSVLSKIDWSRKNIGLWENRAMIRGRMSKARDSVKLTSNLIKKTLEIPLTDKEQELEHRLSNLN